MNEASGNANTNGTRKGILRRLRSVNPQQECNCGMTAGVQVWNDSSNTSIKTNSQLIES